MIEEPADKTFVPALVPKRTTAELALRMLTWEPRLISVTDHVEAADDRFDVTVSKEPDDGGTSLPRFRWAVTRLTPNEQGHLSHEEQWACGLRAYETAEAAYQAAMWTLEVTLQGATHPVRAGTHS